MNKKTLHIFLLFVISITAFSCSSDEGAKDSKTESNFQEQTTKHNIEEAKKIFYLLPSPIETAALIQKSGAEYDKNILNPVENAAKYETTKNRAINLGVYAADLSVASVFDQTQEAMFFISNCKKLSDGLGISEAFSTSTVERIEANINEKDSLLFLISDSYWQTDAYLQENDLANLSALIIAGGWIEGLYVATQLQKASNSNLLKKRIAEQKFSLSHLLEILVTYKEDEKVQGVYNELLDLYSNFSKIKSVKTEPKEGINVIGASSELEMTDEILLEITEKTGKIRNNYING